MSIYIYCLNCTYVKKRMNYWEYLLDLYYKQSNCLWFTEKLQFELDVCSHRVCILQFPFCCGRGTHSLVNVWQAMYPHVKHLYPSCIHQQYYDYVLHTFCICTVYAWSFNGCDSTKRFIKPKTACKKSCKYTFRPPHMSTNTCTIVNELL